MTKIINYIRQCEPSRKLYVPGTRWLRIFIFILGAIHGNVFKSVNTDEKSLVSLWYITGKTHLYHSLYPT